MGFWDAVASAGICEQSAPRSRQHLITQFLQARCSSWRPTYSVKALKGKALKAVAPPGFCNWGEVRYGSIGGLEYEVPQKLTHLLQCIGNFTMKAHTYYIIFGRPPIGGKLPPIPPSGCATD